MIEQSCCNELVKFWEQNQTSCSLYMLHAYLLPPPQDCVERLSACHSVTYVGARGKHEGVPIPTLVWEWDSEVWESNGGVCTSDTHRNC